MSEAFWNYRVIRYEHETDAGYGLCEVHYNGAGEITGFTNPIITGDTIDELFGTLAKMRDAVQKDINRNEVLVWDEVLADCERRQSASDEGDNIEKEKKHEGEGTDKAAAREEP